jgi:hypothetical protein
VNVLPLKEAKYKSQAPTAVSTEYHSHCQAFLIYGLGQRSEDSLVIGAQLPYLDLELTCLR